jgi:hypothetical protein
MSAYSNIEIEVYFPFEPNWKEAYTFNRGKYSTRILRSFTGVEQRSARRTLPLYGIRYTIDTINDMASKLRRMIRGNLHAIWGVPLWHYGMRLTQKFVPGDMSIVVDNASNSELSTFTRIMIGNSYLSQIINYDFTIGITDGITIPVLSTASRNWAIGTYCYPIMAAEIARSQKFSSDLPLQSKLEIEFNISKQFGSYKSIYSGGQVIDNPDITMNVRGLWRIDGSGVLHEITGADRIDTCWEVDVDGNIVSKY